MATAMRKCSKEALKDLVRLPFFADISKDTFIHWPKRWRMYPHQQLARCYQQQDTPWSMESLFGVGWEKN
ncbi:11731_t:CDS:2, partial [Acaulospora colombiana]